MARIIFSWIGGNDWHSCDAKKDSGPILATVSDKQFGEPDEIHLINNYPDKKSEVFKKWLSKKVSSKIVCSDVRLTSPTNWREVYECVIDVVEPFEGDEHELVFLCSPGTFVMSSVWILVSQTKFQAQLLESSIEAGVVEIDVPFDISADYLRDEKRRAAQLGSDTASPKAFSDIEYRCQAMKKAVGRAHRVAGRGLNVLIEGEPGTGKALFARAIHQTSKRHDRSLLSINCSAYDPEQLEAELFGAVFNARLGERQSKKSIFERANRSTLYIDEVDALPGHLQIKLLRAIEDKEIKPISGESSRRFDVRYIFGSSRPLSEQVKNGSMHTDLYYRITEDVIHLPPLRDRGEDLTLIVNDRFEKLKEHLKEEDLSISKKKLSAGARKALKGYPFPGNVRELSNVLARSLVHSEGATISKDEIDEALGVAKILKDDSSILDRPFTEDFSLDDVLAEVSKHYIRRAQSSGISLRKTASILGITNYQTLKKRIDNMKDFDW